MIPSSPTSPSLSSKKTTKTIKTRSTPRKSLLVLRRHHSSRDVFGGQYQHDNSGGSSVLKKQIKQRRATTIQQEEERQQLLVPLLYRISDDSNYSLTSNLSSTDVVPAADDKCWEDDGWPFHDDLSSCHPLEGGVDNGTPKTITSTTSSITSTTTTTMPPPPPLTDFTSPPPPLNNARRVMSLWLPRPGAAAASKMKDRKQERPCRRRSLGNVSEERITVDDDDTFTCESCWQEFKDMDEDFDFAVQWPTSVSPASSELPLDESLSPEPPKTKSLPKTTAGQSVVPFWTSGRAVLVYGDALLALVLRKPSILYGILAMVLVQVSWVALKWIGYVSADPALLTMVKFSKAWWQFAIKEGIKTLSGNSVTNVYFASMAAKGATGVGASVALWKVRSTMRYIRRTQLLHLADRGYGLAPPPTRRARRSSCARMDDDGGCDDISFDDEEDGVCPMALQSSQ